MEEREKGMGWVTRKTGFSFLRRVKRRRPLRAIWGWRPGGERRQAQSSDKTTVCVICRSPRFLEGETRQNNQRPDLI